MESIAQHHEIAAALIARVFLGLLFIFQGYDALIRVKMKNVVYTYQRAFSEKGIPNWMTVFGSYFNSYSALIGGILLLLGLFEYIVLYVLGLKLILASIAFGITRPMWDMKHVFPRLVLLLFLLLIPPSWKVFSLDFFLLDESTSLITFIYPK